jgi:acetyl esterase/lipase
MTAASSRISRAGSGVEVTLEIVPEMQHVFQFLAGTAREGDAAIHRLADWVRPKGSRLWRCTLKDV